MRAQPRPGLGGGQIRLMHLHAGLGHPVQSGHVVFMHMAQDHQIDPVKIRPDAVGHEWRVKGHT